MNTILYEFRYVQKFWFDIHVLIFKPAQAVKK